MVTGQETLKLEWLQTVAMVNKPCTQSQGYRTILVSAVALALTRVYPLLTVRGYCLGNCPGPCGNDPCEENLNTTRITTKNQSIYSQKDLIIPQNEHFIIDDGAGLILSSLKVEGCLTIRKSSIIVNGEFKVTGNMQLNGENSLVLLEDTTPAIILACGEISIDGTAELISSSPLTVEGKLHIINGIVSVSATETQISTGGNVEINSSGQLSVEELQISSGATLTFNANDDTNIPPTVDTEGTTINKGTIEVLGGGGQQFNSSSTSLINYGLIAVKEGIYSYTNFNPAQPVQNFGTINVSTGVVAVFTVTGSSLVNESNGVIKNYGIFEVLWIATLLQSILLNSPAVFLQEAEFENGRLDLKIKPLVSSEKINLNVTNHIYGEARKLESVLKPGAFKYSTRTFWSGVQLYSSVDCRDQSEAIALQKRTYFPGHRNCNGAPFENTNVYAINVEQEELLGIGDANSIKPLAKGECALHSRVARELEVNTGDTVYANIDAKDLLQLAPQQRVPFWSPCNDTLNYVDIPPEVQVKTFDPTYGNPTTDYDNDKRYKEWKATYLRDCENKVFEFHRQWYSTYRRVVVPLIVKQIFSDPGKKISSDDTKALFVSISTINQDIIDNIHPNAQQSIDLTKSQVNETLYLVDEVDVVMPPSVRVPAYMKSDFESIRDSLVDFAEAYISSLGLDHIKAEFPLLNYLNGSQFIVLYLGLVMNILVAILATLSIFLINSLMTINVESRAFELGVRRMLGSEKRSIIRLVVYQALIFGVPSTILGLIAAQLTSSILYSELARIAGFPVNSQLGIGAILAGLIVGGIIPLLASVGPIQIVLGNSLRDALETNRAPQPDIAYKITRADDQKRRGQGADMVVRSIFGIKLKDVAEVTDILRNYSDAGVVDEFGWCTRGLSEKMNLGSVSSVSNIGGSDSSRANIIGVSPNVFNAMFSDFVQVEKVGTAFQSVDSLNGGELGKALYSVAGSQSAIVSASYVRGLALATCEDRAINSSLGCTTRLNNSGGTPLYGQIKLIGSGPTDGRLNYTWGRRLQPLAFLSLAPNFRFSKYPTGRSLDILVSIPTYIRLSGGFIGSAERQIYDKIFIKFKSGATDYSKDEMKLALREKLKNRFAYIKDMREKSKSSAVIQSILDLFFNSMTVVGMTLCFFSLVASMIKNIRDQHKEIGILRSLGLTKNQLVRVYVYEAFVITASSSLFGVVVGTIVAWTFTMQRNLFTQL
eukprot:g3404.t1